MFQYIAIGSVLAGLFGCAAVALAGSVPSAESGTFVVLAAGDIADCHTNGANLTAKLIDRLPGIVLAVGDIAYPNGSDSDFQRCYAHTWGRHKARTFPVPGNHEYHTPGAAGYFRYFGERAHPPGGYYSYELGRWHIIALNSNLDLTEGSVQEKWLRHDLASSRKECKLVYLHHPVFSSGWHGATQGLSAVQRDFATYRVTLVLSGHDHHYERFAPLDALGNVDHDRGTRFFVIGTGGAQLHLPPFPGSGSEASSSGDWGLLKLTLRQKGYDWQWLGTGAGGFADSGQGKCHAPG